MRRTLKTAGLFAGIGGLDLGLEAAGHETVLLAEWDPSARAVLREHFGHAELLSDVAEIKQLPRGIELVTGGFPCQDISQAGRRTGLSGSRSGLVWEFFRLIDDLEPEFFVLENVANLLSLESGRALKLLLETIESLGYRWAYRLVDTRGFGVPQRRQRVIFLASRGEVAPEDVLFSRQFEAEHDDEPLDPHQDKAYGFYWTEGRRGVGWTENAVPTVKGGSGLGIPSPPAIYVTALGTVGTPTIEDGERLQGFRPGWTNVELDGAPLKPGARWKLIGNAVSVPVSDWLGSELSREGHTELRDMLPFNPLAPNRPMPRAAFGANGKWFTVKISTHVSHARHMPILEFLTDPLRPLSDKALAGYVRRASDSTRRIPARFLDDLRRELTLRDLL
jgi:DNA (cytosine-5)-methyltransferase 1